MVCLRRAACKTSCCRDVERVIRERMFQRARSPSYTGKEAGAVLRCVRRAFCTSRRAAVQASGNERAACPHAHDEAKAGGKCYGAQAAGAKACHAASNTAMRVSARCGSVFCPGGMPKPARLRRRPTMRRAFVVEEVRWRRACDNGSDSGMIHEVRWCACRSCRWISAAASPRHRTSAARMNGQAPRCPARPPPGTAGGARPAGRRYAADAARKSAACQRALSPARSAFAVCLFALRRRRLPAS